MVYFDVFNGDADGIMALVQLRLAEPRDATLVTGRKRDIKLLDQVDSNAGDKVTVLDISMRTNADALHRILESGAHVEYFDHHNAGDIPDHPRLTAEIDTSPEICTAMLVDTKLTGQFRAWAVSAAFGDNFPELAIAKADGMNLPLERLEKLGMLVNYNGYGRDLDDLHFHPAKLFRALAPYATPMDFIENELEIYETLAAGYEQDMQLVRSATVIDESSDGLILGLRDEAGSRRASGVFGNQLAQENPDRAHAILTAQQGGYLVSIRAPLSRRTGADTLALQFATGGGRAAAAGINELPNEKLGDFVSAFRKAFAS